MKFSVGPWTLPMLRTLKKPVAFFTERVRALERFMPKSQSTSWREHPASISGKSRVSDISLQAFTRSLSVRVEYLIRLARPTLFSPQTWRSTMYAIRLPSMS